MSLRKYGRCSWAVYDSAGVLVCVCLYKKGAEEVVRRLTGQARYYSLQDNVFLVSET